MSRPIHFEVKGAIYFVTSRTANGEHFLAEPGYKQAVVDAIQAKTGELGVSVTAYVVMPNHYHLLLGLSSEMKIDKAMKHINGYSAFALNKVLQRKGAFWQGGFFDFVVLQEKKFTGKVNYIHYNPVRWGLVEQPQDYKYSSAGDFMGRYGACVFFVE